MAMIIKKRKKENAFEDEYLRELAMPAPFEDSADDLYDRLSRYELNPQGITYNPQESFSIISSEREPKGVFGYILFDNHPIPSVDSKNTRFHRLSFVELVESLYDDVWLAVTFHTIFHRIIKYDTKEDLEIRDIVWLDYDGEPFIKEMDKAYDIYDNMFVAESKEIANRICKIMNASHQ